MKNTKKLKRKKKAKRLFEFIKFKKLLDINFSKYLSFVYIIFLKIFMVKYQVIEVKDKESCNYTYTYRSRVSSYGGGITINYIIYLYSEIIIPPDKNVDYILLIYDVKEFMTKIKIAFEEFKKRNPGYDRYIIDGWFMSFLSYKHKKNTYDTTKKIIYFKNVDEEFINFYSNMSNVIFYFNQRVNNAVKPSQTITNDFGYSFTRIINDFIITDEWILGFEIINIKRYWFFFVFMYNSRRGFFLTNKINPAIEQFYKLMLSNKNQQTKNDLLLYSLLLRDET